MDGHSGEMIKIFIPIETVVRELEYKIFLSVYLANESYQIYVGSKREIYKLIVSSKNFIYLDKGYHKDISDILYKTISSRNGKIINLDEEGVIDLKKGNILNTRYSKVLFKYSKKVLFWGRKQYDESIYKIPHKSEITGHPRFDLLKPTFKNLYQKDVEKINLCYKKFVLINTNMGFGNNHKGEKFVFKNYSKRFNNINKLINNDKKKVNLIIDLAKQLNEYITVVIRPHPEERIETYQMELDNYNNVVINNTKSSIPWIIAAKYTIHFDCTTGIESYMLGKPSISFIPSEINNELIAPIPIEFSRKISSTKEIIKIIKENKLVEKESDKLLDSLFNFSSNSFNNIYIVINEVKLSKTSFNYLTYLALKIIAGLKLIFSKRDEMFEKKFKEFKKIKIFNIYSNAKSVFGKKDVKINIINSELIKFY